MKRKKIVVYTGGTFDLPHIGHIELLEFCRKFAGKDGKVVVALNSDEFIQRFKHKTPVLSYEERRKTLLNFREVDEVVKNIGNEDSRITIEKVKPDMVIIGMDWLERNYCRQMGFDSDWLNKHNISLVYVPRTTGLSTTLIKERVRSKPL